MSSKPFADPGSSHPLINCRQSRGNRRLRRRAREIAREKAWFGVSWILRELRAHGSEHPLRWIRAWLGITNILSQSFLTFFFSVIPWNLLFPHINRRKSFICITGRYRTAILATFQRSACFGIRASCRFPELHVKRRIRKGNFIPHQTHLLAVSSTPILPPSFHKQLMECTLSGLMTLI